MAKPSGRRRNRQTSEFQLEELEPRVLFSADLPMAVLGSVSVADVAQASVVGEQTQASSSTNDSIDSGDTSLSSVTELVIIDAGVSDVNAMLVDLGLRSDVNQHVVVLDMSARDATAALTQLSDVLANFKGLQAVHLISHGGAGELILGGERVDTVDLLANAAIIDNWRSALAPGADLLIYGCDVASGSSGQAFVETLSLLSGADVAASTNLTGSKQAGGDWTFEVQRGNIQHTVAFSDNLQQDYQATFVSYAAINLNDDGAGSLRFGINEANASADDDVISFDVPGTILLDPYLSAITDAITIGGITRSDGNSSEVDNYAVAIDSDAGGTIPSDLKATATSDDGLNVAEHTANSTLVAQVFNTARDEGESITYSLIDDASGRFSIDANTGDILVANGLLLDHETDSSHEVTISSTDGSLAMSDTFPININYVNEEPVFSSNVYIENHSFEVDVLDDSQSIGSATGWVTIGWSAGTWNPPSVVYSSEAPEGQNVGFINAVGSFSQTTMALFAEHTDYQLTVAIGDAISSSETDAWEIRLYAGAQLLGTASNADVNPENDTFADVALSLTSAQLAMFSVNYGENLRVEIYDAGTSENLHFDNVRLMQTSPVITTPTVTYIEAGSVVNLDKNLQIFDEELSSIDDFDGATLKLVRNGGANSDDVFSATGNLLLNAGSLELSSTAVGSYTNTLGELTLSFAASVSNTQINEVMQSIAYSNDSDLPPLSVQIDWTFEDVATGAQNSGMAQQAMASTIVNIIATNDAPTATHLNAAEIYTENTPLDLIDIVVTDVNSATVATSLTLSNTTAGTLSTGTLNLDLTDIVVTDVDRATVTASLTLSDTTAGTLSTGTSNLVSSTFVSGVWSASGVIADVNALLAGVSFIPAENYHSDFTMLTSIDDGVAAALTGNKAFTGNAVNYAPSLLVISNNIVQENTGTRGGLSIGTLSSTDADAGDTSTYSVLSGLDAAVFSIGGVNSDELILTDSVIDFESQSLYSVTIRVTDSGGLTHDQALSVRVNDVNEAPVILDSEFEVSAGFEGVIGQLEATDPDSGDQLIFQLVTQDPVSTLDTIVLSDEGVLSARGADAGTYQFEVKVIDSMGLEDNASLTLHIESFEIGAAIPELEVSVVEFIETETTESEEAIPESEQVVTPFIAEANPPPPPPPPLNIDFQVENAQELQIVGAQRINNDPIDAALNIPTFDSLIETIDADRSRINESSDSSRSFNVSSRVIVEMLIDTLNNDQRNLSGSFVSLFNNSMAPLSFSIDLIDKLDQVRSDAEILETEDELKQNFVAVTGTVVTATLSVGFATWLIQSGLLMASAISTTPLWRGMDPMPILMAGSDVGDDGFNTSSNSVKNVDSHERTPRASGD